MTPSSCPPGRTSTSSDAPVASHVRWRSFAAGATGITLLLLAGYAVTWRTLTAIVRVCPRPFCDFVDYFYPMGEAIFRTAVPVDGFLYSPFAAILFSVFPPLGLPAALVLWGVLQGLAAALCVLLFRRLVPGPLSVHLLFVALFLGSLPFALNLMGGGVTVFTLAGLLGMLAFRRHGSRAGAGALLAFAASFKFYPIIFVAPDVARRDTRALLAGAAALGTVLFVVPGVLLGPAGTLRFYGGLLESFRASDWVVANPHSQYLPHVALRLAEGAGYDARPLLPQLQLVALAAAAANSWLVFLVQRARLPHADLWCAHIVFLTVPFVLKTSWPHDLVYLPFAQALLAWWLVQGNAADPAIPAVMGEAFTTLPSAAAERGRTAVTWLLVLSTLISNVAFYILLGNSQAYGACACLFWASTFVLVASYVVLVPSARRALREAATAP